MILTITSLVRSGVRPKRVYTTTFPKSSSYSNAHSCRHDPLDQIESTTGPLPLPLAVAATPGMAPLRTPATPGMASLRTPAVPPPPRLLLHHAMGCRNGTHVVRAEQQVA
jgi:hypothetical protein